MNPIGSPPLPAQKVPSPALYAEVDSSPVSSPAFSPEGTSIASNVEASMDEGILRAHLLRGKPEQTEIRNSPNDEEHALARTVMRELKRALEQPLFIAQTGDGTYGRFASDNWIPDIVQIDPNCTDERGWRCLQDPRILGKSNNDHVRLQFFIIKGKPGFIISQVEKQRIRVSEPIELPQKDPMALCRAVATAKRACANWSRRPLPAGDEQARELENALQLFYAVKDFGRRMAEWLDSKDPEARMPHPDNARPRPIPP